MGNTTRTYRLEDLEEPQQLIQSVEDVVNELFLGTLLDVDAVLREFARLVLLRAVQIEVDLPLVATSTPICAHEDLVRLGVVRGNEYVTHSLIRASEVVHLLTEKVCRVDVHPREDVPSLANLVAVVHVQYFLVQLLEGTSLKRCSLKDVLGSSIFTQDLACEAHHTRRNAGVHELVRRRCGFAHIRT
jgi:hypothetical protein